MKRLLFATALVAAGAASPAVASQYDNSKMPFPALMNALFGEQTASTERRLDPSRPTYQQPQSAQPKRSYRQPGEPARSARTVRQPSGFVQPGQRLPSYSGMTTAPSGSRNVSAIQPPPRTRVDTRRQLPQFNTAFAPKVVSYNGPERPGTIVINTNERFLYLVQNDGTAMRYGVGVGRPGFEWAGTHKITRKAEWPGWTPPAAMKKRQPGLPDHMPGGPNNPLGARAMYLGSTLYRIHGSNEPWTIGRAVSSGCIRMRNEDVIDLYERVGVGTAVKVI
ncbi:L,D-transpeptidase [Microbaculum marinisediminis]|uniref:L,D-transpeptidase n=1 Tax=Microbaculum marinisediminis TaxID=2931392 RepID=A0AAW5QSG6_9HYPH|nr:L,D-transpeptidase [Microbaculum sp. A6E488]MCT8970419.1 L,D-transpeptidase [Microbaculum sp. A6E488]